jgi:hypothetical protein
VRSSNAAAIASALWDSADFRGAEQNYERAIREDDTDLEALHGLGRLKLAQHEAAAALVLLERALALVDRLPDGSREEMALRVGADLAWAYYRLDRFDLAAEQFGPLPGRVALAAQLRSFDERVPYRQERAGDELEVRFLGTFPLPIVSLTLGRQEYPFVLDTGSGQLVIDRSIQREMQLPDHGSETATFASGHRAPVGYTSIPSVMMGDWVLRDVPAEVMDVHGMAPQLAGLIGTSFLQRFNLLFDWEAERLRLRPRHAAPFAAYEEMTAVPFWFFDGHILLAPARINDHSTLAYIASGMAGAAFTVPESTVRQAALLESDLTMQGVGAGGVATIATVQAERLCLGDWCRGGQEGLAGFFPPDLEWRYGFRTGALISHEFLMGRRWGIDFEHGHLYFD